MLLTQTVLDLLNEQISHERNNSHIYRNVQAYFSNLNLNGWAKYFELQAQGEDTHFEKVINYLDSKNAPYEINVLAYENVQFSDVIEILRKYYDTEILTTTKLYSIAEQAKEDMDHGTIQFLYSFLIPEQIEEENSALNLQSEFMQGQGDNEQLNIQWIRVIDERLTQRLSL